MKNQNLFDAVKERIIEATKKEDYTLLELSDLGFIKKEIQDNRLIHELHTFKDGNEMMEVDFRCYDPSGPFQNLKDINKFEVVYKVDNKSINSYQTFYED